MIISRMFFLFQIWNKLKSINQSKSSFYQKKWNETLSLELKSFVLLNENFVNQSIDLNQEEEKRREKFEFDSLFFHTFLSFFLVFPVSQYLCFKLSMREIQNPRGIGKEDWEEEKKVIICCCDCFRKCKREWRERNGEGKRLDFQRSMRDMNEVSAPRVKRMILFEEKEMKKRMNVSFDSRRWKKK